MKRLLAIILASTTIASAQAPAPAPPSVPPTAGAEMTPEQKKAEAKAHYEKGNTHYNLGEFDKAIDEFKAAYALTSAVGLLFNIAQSYRLAKDYENASFSYRTYLRLKPDAPNKADVEARIAEMDALIEQQKAQEKLPPMGTVNPDAPPDKPAETKPVEVNVMVAPQPAAPVREDGSDGSGRSLKVAGMATAGAGVALAITGIVFGSMASGAEADLNALSADGGAWSQEHQDKYDAGKRNNTIAIVALVGGGAAIATGGILYFLGHGKDKSSSSVAVVPTTQGVMVGGGFSF